MKTRSRIIVSFLVMTIFCFFTTTAFCAGFFADMVETGPQGTIDSRIIVQNDRYRIDTKEKQRNIHIIVDESKKKTWIMVPSDKIVIEKDINDMSNLMKNPFLVLKYLKKKYDIREVGHETIHGYPCTKSVVSIRGKEAMTAWISDRLKFPVRIVNTGNNRTIDLKNIRQGKVKDSFFKIPPDFKKMSKMPVPPPEWAKKIPFAPVLTPPFERELPAGSIIRIKPVKGYHLKSKISNGLDDKSSRFTLVAFKNGRPLKNPSYSTYTLKGTGERINGISKVQPGQADEIVIRVASGKIKVQAAWEEAPEGIILKKAHLKINQGSQYLINAKKASRLILIDTASDNLSSRGILSVYMKEAHDMGDGTIVFKQKELQKIPFNLSNGQSQNWKFSRDQKIGTFGIRILKGAVDIRIEQPRKSGDIPPSWRLNNKNTAARKAADAKVPAAEAAPVRPVRLTDSTRPNIIFILDASGSMWGQINGKPKIQIAKQVMNTLVDQLDGNMRVGLMAYGHRRKGDCSDIEMLLPVGKLDVPAMKAKINAINPKGKTPLSAAVEQAAEHLRYTEDKATVVLISDGLETCNANPCKLAEKLAMNGVDFTVHVIGFDLSREEQNRLKCLADKTGGLFFAASDAGGLLKALFKTVEKVKEPPPPVIEDPGKAVLEAPDSVPAGSTFKVKWQGPDSLQDFISLAAIQSRDLDYLAYAFTKSGNPVHLIAPGEPGKYELRYIHTHSKKVIGRRDIQVTPATAKLIVPSDIEVGKSFSVTWEGPAYSSDLITIASPGQNAASYLGVAYPRSGNSVKLIAPPATGTYEVRYILGNGAKVLAKASIKVKPVSAEIQVPKSVNAASGFQVHWKGPAYPADLITIASPGQNAASYLGIAYPRGGNSVKLVAPPDPGTYEVRYILGNGAKILAKASIEVKPVSAEVQAPKSVNATSGFQVHWKGPGYPADLITIASPGQNAVSYLGIAYPRGGNSVKLIAPPAPGTYEVRYILGNGAKILARTPVIVKKP